MLQSTVNFISGEYENQKIPHETQYLNLVKSRWILQKIKESSHFKEAGRTSLWARCIKKSEMVDCSVLCTMKENLADSSLHSPSPTNTSEYNMGDSSHPKMTQSLDFRRPVLPYGQSIKSLLGFLYWLMKDLQKKRYWKC